MTVIPVGYAEASCRFEVPGPGGPAYVVFGLDPTDPTDPELIATQVFTIWDSPGGLLENMAVGTVLTEVRVVVGIDGGADTFGVANGSAAGGVSGGEMTPQVSYLVKKVTGLTGKSNQGRMFVPGASEDNVGGSGALNATFLGGLQSSAADFLDDLSVGGIPMVLLHTDVADTPTPVTSLVVDPFVATQRRRLR